MNELKNLVERLKTDFDILSYTHSTTWINKHELSLLLPVLEQHLQSNREYTHEEKVQMVRNREASVYHDDDVSSIKIAMKDCFDAKQVMYEEDLFYTTSKKFYFYAGESIPKYFACSPTNRLPKSFLASKFFTTSND